MEFEVGVNEPSKRKGREGLLWFCLFLSSGRKEFA